jgi:two-component sensor histidine kinase
MMSLSHYFTEISDAATSMILVEEISHLVLNEYTEAICALEEAAATATDRCTVDAIATASIRLRTLAEAHRAMQAPIEEGPKDLAPYLAKICVRLSDAELAIRGIRLTIAAEDIELSAAQCWHVGLIVAELVRNASRHGLGGRPGEIRIGVTERFGIVRCTVQDHGGKMPPIGIGRGCRLAEAIAARLGGSVDWRFSPAGCRATLEFGAAIEPPNLYPPQHKEKLRLHWADDGRRRRN